MPPPPSTTSPPISLPIQSIPISSSTTTTSKTPPTTLNPLPLTIQILTPSQLLTQPWLSDLTHMINASYSNPTTTLVEYTSDRLKSDTQLVEEIGEGGFTVVGFSLPIEEERTGKIVGTASVKDWIDDGLWIPASVPDPRVRDGNDHSACPGDLEITIVAVRPGGEYRKRGIAERVVRECELEIGRRIRQQKRRGLSHVKIMLKVVKEINGSYWSKKGFVVVGQRFCPTGTWDSTREFTLWAMMRDVRVDGYGL